MEQTIVSAIKKTHAKTNVGRPLKFDEDNSLTKDKKGLRNVVGDSLLLHSSAVILPDCGHCSVVSHVFRTFKVNV